MQLIRITTVSLRLSTKSHSDPHHHHSVTRSRQCARRHLELSQLDFQSSLQRAVQFPACRRMRYPENKGDHQNKNKRLLSSSCQAFESL
jgi:hypothetical protein